MTARYPSQVSLETVLGCNARCVMCSVRDWKRRHGIMPERVFETALAQLSDLRAHLTYVGLFVDGEPLLDPHLPARIARCKATDLPNVGFTSNASLMTEAKARAILEAEPDWIVFSLDSLDKATYEAIRIRLNFDRVHGNILRFIALRNTLRKKTRIILRFLAHAATAGEFPGYQAYWARHLDPERDELSFTALHNFARSGGAPGTCGWTPCGYLDSRVIILNDGTVPLCCLDINAAHRMGHILEDHIVDIFNSRKWMGFRQVHAEGNRERMKLCRACDLPELGRQQRGFVKMTPDGRVFHDDFMTPFRYEEARLASADIAAGAAGQGPTALSGAAG